MVNARWHVRVLIEPSIHPRASARWCPHTRLRASQRTNTHAARIFADYLVFNFDALRMYHAATACFTSTVSFATIFALRLSHSVCYEHDVIRCCLNLLLQLKRYDECCTLFKELCSHELKYKFDFEQQNFACKIDQLLRLKVNESVLRRLTNSQVMKIVLAQLQFKSPLHAVCFSSIRVWDGCSEIFIQIGQIQG